MIQPRHLPWDPCLNARDLGGYPTRDGKCTRTNRLIRSDSPHQLPPAACQVLLDYGIRTVVDLRFPKELEARPNPFAQRNGTEGWPAYINVPLDEDADLHWPAPTTPARAMSAMYIEILEKNHTHIANALGAIAWAQPGGVLVHCHAGKDRTGLVIAMALAGAGVQCEAIVADYALSSARLMPWQEERMQDPKLSPAERDYLEVLFTSLPDTMRFTLDYLDRHYGSAEGYLATTPLPPAGLQALRQRLVEP